MDSDVAYKFIGYAVVVLFFIYIISKTIRLNTRLIEGLANASLGSGGDKAKKSIGIQQTIQDSE
jgi:hypothetical protein